MIQFWSSESTLILNDNSKTKGFYIVLITHFLSPGNWTKSSSLSPVWDWSFFFVRKSSRTKVILVLITWSVPIFNTTKYTKVLQSCTVLSLIFCGWNIFCLYIFMWRMYCETPQIQTKWGWSFFGFQFVRNCCKIYSNDGGQLIWGAASEINLDWQTMVRYSEFAIV